MTRQAHSRRRDFSHLISGQLLQTLAVGIPMKLAIGWDAAIVVEINPVGFLSSKAVQISRLGCTQFSFKANFHRVFLVINPILARETHGLVTPVCHHIAAIFLLNQAIRQKQPSKTGELIGQDHTPFKNSHSDRTPRVGQDSQCRGATKRIRLQGGGRRVEPLTAAHVRRAAPDQREPAFIPEQQARNFSAGFSRLELIIRSKS